MGRSKRKPSTEPSSVTLSTNSQSGQSSSANNHQNKRSKASAVSCEPTNNVQVLGENPLLTHVVFSKLLKCGFSFHDLQQIRLVCRVWYKYSLNKYRSNATIRLGPTGNDLWGELEWSQVLCRAWNAEDYFKRYNDTNDFHELATYPYTKYMFKGLYFGSSDIFLTGTGRFWDVLGPKIQELKFEDCTFPGEERANGFDKIFTENLQSLETLEFSECQMFPPRETEKLFGNREINQTTLQASPRGNMSFRKLSVLKCLPIDLSVLLINSPNIESIALDCQTKNEYRFYKMVADICNAKRAFENQSYSIKQIKLNLKTASAGDTADLWSEMKLPLEHLSYAAMPLAGRTTGISVVSTVASSCANTLKTIEVFQPPVQSARNLQNLPASLNSLEEIYCYGNVFSNLSFLNASPNLKVLYLEYKLYNNLDKIFKLTKGSDYLWQLEDAYFPMGFRAMARNLGPMAGGLMHLVRFHIDVNLDMSSWTILSQWMPNLKILEAALRQETFREVCRNFTDLEELVLLYESYVGDNEITGFVGDNTKGPRNSDNLTSIRGLKKFVMKRTCVKLHTQSRFSGWTPTPMMFSCEEADRLGDRSVFRGFLEMESLEEVQFHASEQMTENAIKALKEHVAKIDIIRSYGERPHGNGECCKVVAFLNSVEKARECVVNSPIFGIQKQIVHVCG